MSNSTVGASPTTSDPFAVTCDSECMVTVLLGCAAFCLSAADCYWASANLLKGMAHQRHVIWLLFMPGLFSLLNVLNKLLPLAALLFIDLQKLCQFAWIYQSIAFQLSLFSFTRSHGGTEESIDMLANKLESANVKGPLPMTPLCRLCNGRSYTPGRAFLRRMEARVQVRRRASAGAPSPPHTASLSPPPAPGADVLRGLRAHAYDPAGESAALIYLRWPPRIACAPIASVSRTPRRAYTKNVVAGAVRLQAAGHVG